jgi:hypothetical protein
MAASTGMSELDWTLVRLMDDPDGLAAAYAAVVSVEPRRAEALLHAWPGETAPPSVGIHPLGRWQSVEQAIGILERIGVATSRDEVELVAARAARHADETSNYSGEAK